MSKQLFDTFGKAVSAILDIQAEDLPLEDTEIVGEMFMNSLENGDPDFPKYITGETVLLFDFTGQPIGHGIIENWFWDAKSASHYFDVKLDIGPFFPNVPEALLEAAERQKWLFVHKGGRA